MATKQVTLPVTGMTCANCSLTVERNLKRLDGVEQATVNLATERVSLAYDPAVVGEGHFLALIRDIGYDVPMARVELPVTGMTCANCALTIERVLIRLDGVVSVSANLATERASVEYLPGVVSLAAIRQNHRDLFGNRFTGLSPVHYQYEIAVFFFGPQMSVLPFSTTFSIIFQNPVAFFPVPLIAFHLFPSA